MLPYLNVSKWKNKSEEKKEFSNFSHVLISDCSLFLDLIFIYNKIYDNRVECFNKSNICSVHPNAYVHTECVSDMYNMSIFIHILHINIVYFYK